MSEETNNDGKTIVVQTKSKSSLSTVFIWLFAIIIGIVIGSVFAPKIPFIGNKAIKELEKENKELRIQIENRNENIIVLKEKVINLNSDKKDLETIVSNRDTVIRDMQLEIDSISTTITAQDSILIKIYDEKYKDISNVITMDINERISFFSNYFKLRAKSN